MRYITGNHHAEMNPRVRRTVAWITTILCLCCVIVPGCSKSESGDQQSSSGSSDGNGTNGPAAVEPSRDHPFTVYTTFYPMTYLTQRIAGAHVRVVCPLPREEDAIFWQPSRDVITQYQKSDLIVVNGAEFEKWVSMASLPLSRVVNTADGFRDRWLKFETTVHSHGATGQHAHEGVDGHTWIDPIGAAEQAQAIAIALKRDLPDFSEDFDRNLKSLGDDLMALDERLQGLMGVVGNALILCSHPAYNYLAARYDWQIHNLALDPETEPTDEQWASLKTVVEEADPSLSHKVMLWEAHPLASVATRLADEFGVVSVVFDPCEQADEQTGDYLARMNVNIDRLAAAIGGDQ